MQNKDVLYWLSVWVCFKDVHKILVKLAQPFLQRDFYKKKKKSLVSLISYQCQLIRSRLQKF